MIASDPTPAPPHTSNKAQRFLGDTLAATLGVLQAIALLLAARALLMLSLIGAFVLALIASRSESSAALYVLIAYAVLIVLPLVYLAVRERQGG